MIIKNAESFLYKKNSKNACFFLKALYIQTIIIINLNVDLHKRYFLPQRSQREKL